MELMEQELTEKIIGSCFEVSKELGVGFLKGVYTGNREHSEPRRGEIIVAHGVSRGYGSV